MRPERRYSAGQRVGDLCRVCKTSRIHVVVAVGADGAIAQVQCDFCGSRHRFRGGEAAAAPADLVSDRERRFPVTDAPVDLEMMLRRVIREETGLTPVALAEKWRGGDLVLRPSNRDLQDKSMPIETFFHKIVMLRNRLRVLEQQINGLDVSSDVKIKLQGYITGCYGSLTSFNVLFADPQDRFRGSGGGSDGADS